MRVILIQNVNKLGIVGDEKNVKDGFARNWLIPQKLAVRFDDPQAKEIIKKAKEEKEKMAKEIEQLKKLAVELSQKTISVKAKVGEKGKLFGSVRAEEIIKAISDKRLAISSKQIEMEPIKEIGEHQITIKLGQGMETKTKIKIEAEEEKKKSTSKK